jgi:hypothetical protein
MKFDLTLFWRKKIGGKATLKMLLKLTPTCLLIIIFFLRQNPVQNGFRNVEESN